MALYGGKRDIGLFRSLNRELLNRIICEVIGYYKLSLSETKENIYGESKQKKYYNPVMLTCLIAFNPDTTQDEELPNSYGGSTSNITQFRFLRDDLLEIELVPEKGDIIMWNESYYEVENLIENQPIVGKTPEYSLIEDLQNFGRSWSIGCDAVLTNQNKLNLVTSR